MPPCTDPTLLQLCPRAGNPSVEGMHVAETGAARRQDMVSQVSSLVNVLRALAAMGSQPVRDVEAQPHVLWWGPADPSGRGGSGRAGR
ncbi:hypothetical protein GCM10027519_47460 [Kineococcus endophyticus]